MKRLEEACAILARHNEWRTSEENKIAAPADIGLAIETVVTAAKEAHSLRMRVSELEGIAAFDSALQELEARGRRIEALEEALDEAVADAIRMRAAIRQTLDENGHLADGDNCTLIVLKRAIGTQPCKKCGADMKPGVAIGQTFTGMADFIGGECCTVSPGGPGKLVECSKCPECGWSTT